MSYALSLATWRPHLGDPTPLGWLTVVAYGVAAWLCLRARGVASAEAERGTPHRSAAIWGALALGLILLGINKQLDLQSAINDIGRNLAREQGWYQRRQTIQLAFLIAVLLCCAVLAAWFARLARFELSRLAVALVGLMLVLAFIALRTASIHHLDRVLPLVLEWSGMLWTLEMTGIGLIALGAWLYVRGDR